MRSLRLTTLPATVLALAACTDAPTAPTPAPAAPPPALLSAGLGDFHRYIAIGTSISAGVQGDGKVSSTQRTSWPAQLARLAGRELPQPYLIGTGCRSPLESPLITFRRISGEPAGTPASSLSCSPLQEGITLPTANVAINGARAVNALFSTPENIADPDNAKVYPRTLAPGQTQVTAMMAQNPKIVSVELFGNEVLLARTGIAIPGVTLATLEQFTVPYDAILDSIEKVGAKAILVGASGSIANFPAFRRGADVWAERQSFLAYNVQVASDCENSQNLLFIPFKVPQAVGAGLQSARSDPPGPPAVLSCAALPNPGAPDLVLDANELAIVDGLLNAIGAHIRAQAEARGFAHVDIGVMYDRAENRPPLNAQALMQGPTPYGPNISIDGVHPTAAGARILADAAAGALNERYALGIPRVPTPETNVAPVVTELLAYARGTIGPITGLNGDLLRFRLADRGDPGPWRLRVEWGDGVVSTPTVTSRGVISLLRQQAFPGPGTYTVVVTATDLAGAASAPRSVTITVP